jgi:hypothetical protein
VLHIEEIIMQTQSSFEERIAEEVCSWPGIAKRTGPAGESSFSYRGCEIGHLHEGVAHFVFPAGLWLGLVDEGHVELHPLRRIGWAERRIESYRDAEDVIALLRLNYDRLVRPLGSPLVPVGQSA